MLLPALVDLGNDSALFSIDLTLLLRYLLKHDIEARLVLLLCSFGIQLFFGLLGHEHQVRLLEVGLVLGHVGVNPLLDYAVKTAAQVAVEMQVAKLVFTDRLSIAVKWHEVDELEVFGWHGSWREFLSAFHREVDILRFESMLALSAHGLALLDSG